jgi:ATP-dependent phosphofructokinase / diphosphate-dependent phosphofructokinase
MAKRIGILTGGGDCPGLNAVLRAAGKTLLGRGLEVVGFEDGFLGVMEKRFRVLRNSDLSGILSTGGTILGTSNRDNPFAWKPRTPEFKDAANTDCSDQVVALARELQLEGLIVIGGDGSLSIADRLVREKNIRCIGVPKTIDNDLSATDVTFGFDTAVAIATICIDRLHSTAMSHHRVMVVEVMGRYAGWIALFAGVAGGGDVILLPELPYRMEVVNQTLLERSTTGKRFSLVVVAEGAKAADGDLVVNKVVKDSPDPLRLGGIGQMLVNQIEDATGLEARVSVLGHLQRGGSPTAHDRLLATEFGARAARLAMEGGWDQMVAFRGGQYASVPLSDAVRQLKRVPLDHSLITAARSVGTSFGDA